MVLCGNRIVSSWAEDKDILVRTLGIAREIVQGLKTRLASCSPSDLPGIQSVCAYGSIARGDWFDCNSDLDLAVLFHPDTSESDATGYKKLQEMARGILAGRAFPAHTPGGIDWCTLPSFPRRDDEVRQISGFFHFNIFLFDFLAHSEILWGEDFRARMPAPPDPASLAAPWFEAVVARVQQLHDTEAVQFKAPSNAYKATLVAQLVFGERTLDKRRILELYCANVPEFPMKTEGEKLIRQYVGAIYPDCPPKTEDPLHYMDLILELERLVCGAT